MGTVMESNTAFSVERSAAVAAPAFDPHAPFDPLVDLDGLWTPELADRYLPIPGMPPAKYECLDGKLIVSPYEGSANVYAADELYLRMRAPARRLGGNAYTTLNVEMPQISAMRWAQPDFAVLREPARGRVWIPTQAVLLIGECVSKSSRHNDYVDKPAEYAKAGIPYFMRVDIARERERVSVELLRLEDGEYRDHAKALDGQTFETELPFSLSFDPAELLEL
ncbi:Uma2 family endonuclease [Saccharopolyspora sp. K220]|uniref:Uma2 family endonuclease n=1 Tax=Saccharopolyspora soli TaxID=2926618 RepID=UPI001F56C5D3|nr:Uma2 family endonuclease [Saccharopolyspora soli]MCI2417690.1 Uma2 family endonuclease [Saccharopolyspora soli]